MILDEAKTKFARDRTNDQVNGRLRWIITGCAGSGKSLLLLQMARDFLSFHPTGRVFIRILDQFQRLAKLMRDDLMKDEWKDRVIVGAKLNQESLKSVSLVLYDEFYRRDDFRLYAGDEERFHSLAETKPSFVLFSGRRAAGQLGKSSDSQWTKHILHFYKTNENIEMMKS